MSFSNESFVNNSGQSTSSSKPLLYPTKDNYTHTGTKLHIDEINTILIE